jgi:hypothetical protein
VRGKMKKIKVLEYITLFFITLVVTMLGYGYVFANTITTVGSTTTTITPCTPMGIYTPIDGATAKGPLTVKLCQPGSTGALFRLVYLYTTGPGVMVDSQTLGLYPTVDVTGKVMFPAYDTTKIPDGPYQLNIQVWPTQNILARNIWIKNGLTTTTPTTTTPNTTTSTGVITVPPTVTNDVTNLGTTGTSTTAVQDYVNKQIAAAEEKKLPADLKAAPVSIVLTTEKAEVKMLNDKKGKVTFSGKAEPNITIYLYIFSEPVVVSVKTDSAGNWNYSLDSELDTGKHDVYVAVKNDDGTIKAKSLPYSFFVGQATAAADGTPSPTVQKANYTLYYVIFAISAVSLIVSAIFYLVAKKHTRKHEELAQN